MKKHIVWAMAGGCVIGYQDENDFGQPLTLREANKIVRLENERSERRRAQKLGGAFDYCVHSFDPTEAKTH